ncbi:hypothetical protein ACEWPM_007405 [Roseovarius sp. S4756]
MGKVMAMAHHGSDHTGDAVLRNRQTPRAKGRRVAALPVATGGRHAHIKRAKHSKAKGSGDEMSD